MITMMPAATVHKIASIRYDLLRAACTHTPLITSSPRSLEKYFVYILQLYSAAHYLMQLAVSTISG